MKVGDMVQFKGGSSNGIVISHAPDKVALCPKLKGYTWKQVMVCFQDGDMMKIDSQHLEVISESR